MLLVALPALEQVLARQRGRGEALLLGAWAVNRPSSPRSGLVARCVLDCLPLPFQPLRALRFQPEGAAALGAREECQDGDETLAATMHVPGRTCMQRQACRRLGDGAARK